MKVRGHLQMYHAYIHESHPPSDSAPEEVNVTNLKIRNGMKVTFFVSSQCHKSLSQVGRCWRAGRGRSVTHLL